MWFDQEHHLKSDGGQVRLEEKKSIGKKRKKKLRRRKKGVGEEKRRVMEDERSGTLQLLLIQINYLTCRKITYK